MTTRRQFLYQSAALPASWAAFATALEAAAGGRSDEAYWQLITNIEPELSGGVVKFRLKNTPTAQAYDLLWKRHRLAIAMTAGGDSEGLRFSPHIYNSFDEIDCAVAAVGELTT